MLEAALGSVSSSVGSLGLESEPLNSLLFERIARQWPSAEIQDITPVVGELRRRKDADELRLIQRCVKAIEAGYPAVRSVIQPGVNELEIFNAVHAEIVKSAGYQLKVTGDFACGVRAIRGGGTPLDRKIEPGDLCILDLLPQFLWLPRRPLSNLRGLRAHRSPISSLGDCWARAEFGPAEYSPGRPHQPGLKTSP